VRTPHRGFPEWAYQHPRRKRGQVRQDGGIMEPCAVLSILERPSQDMLELASLVPTAVTPHGGLREKPCMTLGPSRGSCAAPLERVPRPRQTANGPNRAELRARRRSVVNRPQALSITVWSSPPRSTDCCNPLPQWALRMLSSATGHHRLTLRRV
jgi:hypothetical protein